MDGIRPAAPRDLRVIRDLQTDSWQRTYRGMVPDAFLDVRAPGLLARRWAEHPGPNWIIEIFWRKGRAEGFLAADPEHEGGPYVDNLHVTAAAQGRGVGRMLMAAVAGKLVEGGHKTLWLTVMRDNLSTRRFYKAIGGVEGAARTESMLGQQVCALPVRWNDLPALAAIE